MRIMEKAQLVSRLKERIYQTRHSDPEASAKLQKLLDKVIATDQFDYLNG